MKYGLKRNNIFYRCLITGFLQLTFLLIGGRLSAVEYAVGMVSAAIVLAWLLSAAKALRKYRDKY